MIAPEGSLVFHEKAWNAYPYCRTSTFVDPGSCPWSLSPCSCAVLFKRISDFTDVVFPSFLFPQL